MLVQFSHERESFLCLTVSLTCNCAAEQHRTAVRCLSDVNSHLSFPFTNPFFSYGFPCFSHSTTARQGPAAMQPWECNGVISLSGVTVRPGDAVVGDQDGVVVVPAKVAQTVYNIAHGREVIEGIVKEELSKNPGPPGKFYPFMSGKIKVDSPLGKLLSTKGITPENSNQFEGTADW
jgi:Aldolase/RraA